MLTFNPAVGGHFASRRWRLQDLRPQETFTRRQRHVICLSFPSEFNFGCMNHPIRFGRPELGPKTRNQARPHRPCGRISRSSAESRCRHLVHRFSSSGKTHGPTLPVKAARVVSYHALGESATSGECGATNALAERAGSLFRLKTTILHWEGFPAPQQSMLSTASSCPSCLTTSPRPGRVLSSEERRPWPRGGSTDRDHAGGVRWYL